MNRTIRRIHRSPTLLIGTQLPSRLPPLWSRQASTTSDTIPRVAQPSLWQSIIPKFLRKSERSTTVAASRKRKEWNPATFYVVVYMLIGSNAINLITLRKDFTNFSRKADAQIALLQEVLERVQKGEHVDVEALLGTGDEEREQEWAKVLEEIEKEDAVLRSQKDRKRAKNNPSDQALEDTSNTNKTGETRTATYTAETTKSPGNPRPANFY